MCFYSIFEKYWNEIPKNRQKGIFSESLLIFTLILRSCLCFDVQWIIYLILNENIFCKNLFFNSLPRIISSFDAPTHLIIFINEQNGKWEINFNIISWTCKFCFFFKDLFLSWIYKLDHVQEDNRKQITRSLRLFFENWNRNTHKKKQLNINLPT